MGYVLDKVSVGFGLLAVFFSSSMASLCTYEVVMRYVFNSPTIWVLEITIYLVIASTFFALAYVLDRKGPCEGRFLHQPSLSQDCGNLGSLHLCPGHTLLPGSRLGGHQDHICLYMSWEVSPTTPEGTHVYSQPVYSPGGLPSDYPVREVFLGSRSED